MNRDELRTRKESGLLYSRSVRDVRLFYPVDVSSGGSWFGVNNKGVTLALLNRYHAADTANARSRGEIIPRALEQGEFSAVESWLHDLDFAAYNPFDLFLVPRKLAGKAPGKSAKKEIMHFSWNGEEYSARPLSFKHWFMFTSSSMLTEEVIDYRNNLFQAWSSEIGKIVTDASEILRGFHLIQFDGLESHSVLMERERSHTKSVIQAVIEGRKLTLNYIPEVLDKSLDAPLAEAQVETIEIRKS